jgi:arginine exporter protein ArgO
MQRRAAAAYFLFFLVLSVGAYAIDTVANAPAMRSQGLVAVAVMSALAAILIMGTSYLPVRG